MTSAAQLLAEAERCDRMADLTRARHYIAHVSGREIISLPALGGKVGSTFDIPTAERMLQLHRDSVTLYGGPLGEMHDACANELEAALKDAERQRETMAAIAA